MGKSKTEAFDGWEKTTYEIKEKVSEDHILTIYLEGAIDSATAPEAEKKHQRAVQYFGTAPTARIVPGLQQCCCWAC